jgi:hypothetical protein
MAPLSSVTLTDGLNTVDITTSTIKKVDSARIATLKPPNRPGDVVQPFGTTGFTMSVTGQWATGAGVADYRSTMRYWHDNNILVYYNDGNTFGWFHIHKYADKLVPGHPTATTMIEYEFQLGESIRQSVDDSGGLPLNTPGVNGLNIGLSTALQFSQQGHTFVSYDTGAPIYWVASTVSADSSTFGKITLWASSTGADWTKVTDISGSNATSGLSCFCNPSTSLFELTWAESNNLKYRRGTISAETISWSPTVTVGTSTNFETNLNPYLYVSSAGTDFITVTSGGGLWMTYDSMDGINWFGRPAYPTPTIPYQLFNTTHTPSFSGDVNRYAVMWESILQSTGSFPIASTYYIKRIVFHSQSTGAIGTTAIGGTSETDYSIPAFDSSIYTNVNGNILSLYGAFGTFALGDNSKNSLGTGEDTMTLFGPTYNSAIAGINDPYYSVMPSSVGHCIFVDSAGNIRYTMFSEWMPGKPYTLANGWEIHYSGNNLFNSSEYYTDIYGNVITQTSAGAQFLTIGVTSSSVGLIDFFFVQNQVIKRYTFNTTESVFIARDVQGNEIYNHVEVDTTNTPLGMNFSQPSYLSTPRYVMNRSDRFVVWTEEK